MSVAMGSPGSSMKPCVVRKDNPWLAHVKCYRVKHPECAYKDCLRNAKETYTKKPRPATSNVPKPNPWMQHIKQWKEKNPEWKKTNSYKQVLILCKETYKKDQMDVSG